MSDYITRIRTKKGNKQIDYNALANLPELPKPSPSVGGGLYIVNATSSDGRAYTATDDRITEVQIGTAIILVPDVACTTTTPTLDLNGTGAVQIGLASSISPAYPRTPTSNFLMPGCPFILIRSSTGSGERWLAVTSDTVAYAVQAGSANSGGGSSGGNADTFGGYSYGQLFGSDFSGNPSAIRANSLMGVVDGNSVGVSADAVIANQNAIAALQGTVDGHWVQTQANATSIQAVWDVLWPLVERVEALEGK